MTAKQRKLLVRIIVAAVFFVPLYLISECWVAVTLPKAALIALYIRPAC